jgi:hypothetical protein
MLACLLLSQRVFACRRKGGTRQRTCALARSANEFDGRVILACGCHHTLVVMLLICSRKKIFFSFLMPRISRVENLNHHENRRKKAVLHFCHKHTKSNFCQIPLPPRRVYQMLEWLLSLLFSLNY